MSLQPVAEESGRLSSDKEFTAVTMNAECTKEVIKDEQPKPDDAKKSLRESVLQPLGQLLKAADNIPAMGNSLLEIIKELSTSGDTSPHKSVFENDDFDSEDIFENSEPISKKEKEEEYYEEEVDDDSELRTSETHPIDVDFITAFPLKTTRHSVGKKGKVKLSTEIPAAQGRLGMSSAPGKQVKNNEYTWYRDMEEDIRTLKLFHKTDVLISLMVPEEYKALNMTSLSETCLKYDIQPIFFPIQDQNIPYLFQYPQFKNLIKYIVHSVQYENKCVIVHCRRGKGRTGLVVACCLVYAGFHPDKAIKHCRKYEARP